ncbi:fatty-acid amide hydrolase [Malassezia pachydermatis]|uniref:Fatty-acid amide hydrolase n=1 Tax=Malassezia pachydermatis TaxID=77020 RepID=A0A0N0RS21_9BASI|nr:fatty-acid amide hydrolase [Malassezia pachydermatis]KOS13503.1 fatty-acid amide hydrolase [Malassezia pachydermatis]
MTPEAEQRIAAKRQALAEAIPKEWRLADVPTPESMPNVIDFCASQLSAEERRITDMPFETLCTHLQSGTLTSRAVVTAFAHRAAVAQQLTSCLTEFLLPSALARADELDAHLAKTGTPVGPLHGLPVSLKDLFYVEGGDTTVGFVAWLGEKATREDEAGVVAMLRKAGAVFYVKTNVPTSMMCAESINNIFGWTRNAHNRLCSAAGSSGGEGTLLSLRGAPLGVGSDIGGSIRLPASVAGVWGLKVTPGRFSTDGVRRILPGQVLVPAVVGPMANSLGALQVFTQLALADQPWLRDPSVVELPWRPVTLAPKLVLGLLVSDGVVHPQPPIEKALREVAEAMRDAGHEVIEFTPPDHGQALALWLGIMCQTGGEQIHDLIEEGGETLIDEVAEMIGAAKGERPAITIAEAYDQAETLHEFRAEYEQAWNETATQSECGRPMDGLLMPNTGVVCWKRGGTVYHGYTPVGNVLHYPSVSMPLATAEPLPKPARDDFLSSVDEEAYEAYDPSMVKGMPIGIQLMGRRFQEEKVLAMAQVVEAAVRQRQALQMAASL